MDSKSKVNLTNEFVARKFKNNFNMVLYAIKVAENMIKSGRAPRVRTVTENKAMIVIEEIAAGKDHFTDLDINNEEFGHDELSDELPNEVYVLEDEHKEKMVIVDAED